MSGSIPPPPSTGFALRLGPITIGPDAWIAARAVLAPGTIVRGNPAVLVGQR